MARLHAAVLSWVACLAVAGPAWGNFEVHGTPLERAESIIRHAEQLRMMAFRELLGTDQPDSWTVPCAIHLHADAGAFAAAVGGPPDHARGATSIEFAGPEVSLRRIDLMDDDPGSLPAALAHELVHVVLADHFTAGPPPRWADEGLAVLFDSADTQTAHRRDFEAAKRDGMTWSASHLLVAEAYPREPHRQRIFYGQSADLVRWLVARRGTATLIAFLDDAARLGDREALERHYGFSSPAALEREWLGAPAPTDIGRD